MVLVVEMAILKRKRRDVGISMLSLETIFSTATMCAVLYILDMVIYNPTVTMDDQIVVGAGDILLTTIS
jgi:hypothetical protein